MWPGNQFQNFLWFLRIKYNLSGKWIFLKLADYIGYVMAALRKYDKISMQIPFYREFHVFKEASSKLKEELELVSATFFAGFFDRNYEIF